MDNQTAKADAGKPKLTLVPRQIIYDIAEVREYGNKKYGNPENWKTVEIERYHQALLRHTLAVWEDISAVDEEKCCIYFGNVKGETAMIVCNRFCTDKCGNSDEYYLFDTSMKDVVSNSVWTLDGKGYACRNNKGTLERMHTIVVENATGKKIPEGMYVDHINEDKLDNRLCNLRIVSPQESARNMPIKSNNTTGVTGVAKASKGNGYRAYITVNKKRMCLGTYPTIEEAARVRHCAEQKYGFKSKQNLNAFLCEMERGANNVN